MEIVCLETEAFYQLVETVVKRIQESEKVDVKVYISTQETMEILGIKSKSTLQKLRDEGQIIFTQPSRKIILYKRDSILDYLENHTKK